MESIFLLLLGLISGILSYVFGSNPLGIYFIPGLVFGAILSFYFSLRKVSSAPRRLLFTAVSTIAYFIAVQTFFAIAENHDYAPVVYISVGMLGASILILGFHFLIIKLNILRIGGLIAAGGILGLSWHIIPMSYDAWHTPIACWQTGMAFAIGLAARGKLRK